MAEAAKKCDLIMLGANYRRAVPELINDTTHPTIALIKRAPPLRSWGKHGGWEWVPRLNPADYAGVAITVALVPPLCSLGICLAYQEFSFATGAAVLFVTNLVAIILVAAGTFRAMGVTNSWGIQMPESTCSACNKHGSIRLLSGRPKRFHPLLETTGQARSKGNACYTGCA